jgi:hypothetical protein
MNWTSKNGSANDFTVYYSPGDQEVNDDFRALTPIAELRRVTAEVDKSGLGGRTFVIAITKELIDIEDAPYMAEIFKSKLYLVEKVIVRDLEKKTTAFRLSKRIDDAIAKFRSDSIYIKEFKMDDPNSKLIAAFLYTTKYPASLKKLAGHDVW